MELIKENIFNLMKECKFNGNILIAKNEEVLFNEGYGYSDIETKKPFKGESIFRIGSITKQFTAFCVLQLVDKGLIFLEDPISKYINGIDYKDEITIHHLLSNSSGIPNFDIYGDYDELLRADNFHERMIKEIIFKLPLNFKPGEKFEYSSSGFFILTYIIELISKMHYSEYLEKFIFKPLDMKYTGFHFIDTSLPEFVSLYDYKDNKVIKAMPYDMRKASGAGGMFSTTLDIFKWNRALIDAKLISKKYIDLMFDIQTPISSSGGYGYGLINYKFDVEGRSHFASYHPGNGPGVFAQNMIIDNNIQFFIISNINVGKTFQELFE